MQQYIYSWGITRITDIPFSNSVIIANMMTSSNGNFSVTQSFGVFFDLRLNKWLSKQ